MLPPHPQTRNTSCVDPGTWSEAGQVRESTFSAPQALLSLSFPQSCSDFVSSPLRPLSGPGPHVALNFDASLVSFDLEQFLESLSVLACHFFWRHLARSSGKCPSVWVCLMFPPDSIPVMPLWWEYHHRSGVDIPGSSGVSLSDYWWC